MKKRLMTLMAVSLLGISAFILAYKPHNKYNDMVNAAVTIPQTGSGVFIADNLVLTAGHVARLLDTTRVVELSDGNIVNIKSVYIDDRCDVGFLSVDANEPGIVNLGRLPDIGDTVYIVGYMYGKLPISLTKGIVSFVGRNVFNYKDVIQTDAEAAVGSSGSPLYNERGRVIGICVGGPNPGGGASLCENVNKIKEALERYYAQ